MRTNMKFWPAKRMLCLALCILMLVGIAMPSIDTVARDGRGSLLGSIFGFTQAMADETYTVTYLSGEGVFPDGSVENVVVYGPTFQEPLTKYSHTPNISDDGTKNSNYGASLNTND